MKRRLSSELAAAPRLLEVRRRLGEGATSVVWQAELGGVEVALKVARDPRHVSRLADEADRLLLVGSTALTQVLDAGFVPPGVAGCEALAGHAFIALELAPGAALAPTDKQPARARSELALIVARDVGEALADLHAAGSAHGDVKPANVIFDPRARRARLVDLGLGTGAAEEIVRGGTRRYLAPEVFSDEGGGDARSRDLWALGLLVAEVASAEVARSADPASQLASSTQPATVDDIVRALTAGAPRARPSADWVHRRASHALGGTESDPSRRRRAVERAYLGVRRREILHAASRGGARISVEGTPGVWLTRAVGLARRVAELRGNTPEGAPVTLAELDAFGRSRWLVGLIGASAAHWPAPRAGSDATLADRLIALCEASDPASFSLASIDSGTAQGVLSSDEPVELALAAASGSAPAEVLDRAEQVARGGRAPMLGLVLARTLRARGEYGRALSVLDTAPADAAALEKAETLRRAGDPERARLLLAEARNLDEALRARRAATLARIELDAGHPDRARSVLHGVAPTAATLEVQALLELGAEDRRAAADSALRGAALATSDEEHARLAAVQGFIAHTGGDAQAAVELFRRAIDHAVRAGAILEEATYLTGLAAAAATLGHFAEALDAARRSLLLFEHLHRPREAARAALSRTAVFAQAGAVAEARDAAQDCIARARVADDRRCRGYAHLALADVLPEDDPEGAEQALRAQTLLAESSSDDQLHVGARLLRRGQPVSVAELDARARNADAAIEPRLEWWGARARAEASSDAPNRPESVLAELSLAFSAPTPLGIRGPALAAGANLAARIGHGDTARRLALGAREAAREIARHAPPELRTAIASLPWLAELKSPREADVSAEQVSDVETLVHALGRRDRLRPLLDQVLDALILWTGVERGLLLLRAPGGKLVPRAGRNIARADLSGEQLALSMSLAERALEQREPVVAVDAAGELPDVHASAHALKLRSVLSVPLISRGEVLGVVYLDDRIRRGAFGTKELSWVRLVAALASVAIADARDQLLLRRAARRASRAEARLSVELAEREAALDVAERELARTRDSRETRFRYDEIIGQSEPLNALLRLVDRVALSEVPVLISGESGSGKELVARAIHAHGSRASRPFVGENCGAIPEGLLESALFGHTRGAFTGASRPRAGLFEVADGGTLFLDEIAEMSLGMQTKLLRVLEDGEVHPLGSERARRVDVRVIGATHRDLEALVAAGRFREDLWYRLNVITLRVPSLRERRSDIPLLVRFFVEKHAGSRNIQLTRAALDRLTRFDWPGNIRQLENEVRRALVLADERVDVEHLSPDLREPAAPGASPENELDLRARVDALEAELVGIALERTLGNQTRAAELLGLSRFGLQKMMKRLAIEASPKPGRRPTNAVGRAR